MTKNFSKKKMKNSKNYSKKQKAGAGEGTEVQQEENILNIPRTYKKETQIMLDSSTNELLNKIWKCFYYGG